MRTLWKGAISFGLVNIPVKMYTATERKDIRFNQLHATCKTPIQYRKFCPVCQKEVGADELVRGYEYEKGRYVILWMRFPSSFRGKQKPSHPGFCRFGGDRSRLFNRNYSGTKPGGKSLRPQPAMQRRAKSPLPG